MPTAGDLHTLLEEVELRISVSNQPFSSFDEFLCSSRNPFQVKVRGIDKHSKEEVAVTIKVYNFDESCCKHQSEYGREFKEGEFGVFSARTRDPSSLLFLLEVFCQDAKGQESLFGSCYLPSSEMGEPRQVVAITTDKQGVPVGEISVQTHLILPWLKIKEYKDLPVQEWKSTRQALVCGHRGMGRNKRDKSLLSEHKAQGSALFPENTVAAFKQAHKLSVPMVEFDVHVTKDGVPVIFHDFDTDLGIEEDVSGKVLDLTTVHINSMKHKQIEVLRNLQPCVQGSTSSDWKCSFLEPGEISVDHRPLPTVQEALESVNEDLAFHIEVKYPMTDEYGNQESEAGNRSHLLDSLLDVVYKYASKRRIVFSAFDPDLCIMLRMKQHRYPVLLANYGQTAKYASYRGVRCSSAKIGVCLAIAENLQGLNGHSDDYVAEPWLISSIHDNGLILCVWGEENNEAMYQKKLKELQVDFIITDK
ncbi:glycerophosphocholine phosphodiesterase GPCPD1-like [Apostichopus japonicus]|uniref:glycerophosphocholine phosphodiesterase GPCPD1-like n=1 Tax=Stichopus japonicus TaxID=307972 RepID=UPI003AB1830B